MVAFDRDVVAASSRAAGCALWNTWRTFHSVWFGEEAPAIPLDAIKIRKIAACFKKGSYKGYRMYLSKAKEQHLLAGSRGLLSWIWFRVKPFGQYCGDS